MSQRIASDDGDRGPLGAGDQWRRPSIEDLACPTPLREYADVTLGNGGGGALSAELVEGLLLPAFGGPPLKALADSALATLPSERLAISTDAFVVRG